MAKVTKMKPASSLYYVYDNSVDEGHLGGVKFQERDGKTCIRLTDKQASYWLDQGVIGTSPEPTAVHKQMLRQSKVS